MAAKEDSRAGEEGEERLHGSGFLSRAVRGGLQGKVTLEEGLRGKREPRRCLGTVPQAEGPADAKALG